MHFDFIMAVWGESFTDLFLKMILPNQLTPGNLVFFGRQRNATYRIYTTNRDAVVIRASAVFKKLEETVGTEIVSIDSVLEAFPQTHYALTAAHKRAIASPSDPGNTGFVFLCPDAVVSEGTFARLWELASAGKRAVMVPGMRLVKETFSPRFYDCFLSPDRLSAAPAPRDLVGLALDHLHPLSQCMFWDSPHFSTIPSHLYWKVGNDGAVLRCFHLHPLFVKPELDNVVPTTTIDGDFLVRACPNVNDIHIVEDSDEMAVFELSPASRKDYLPQKAGQLRLHSAAIFPISRWAVYHTDGHHRRFVEHVLRIHANDLNDEWRKVEQDSESVVRAIMRLHPVSRVICPIPDLVRSGIQELRCRARIRTRLRSGMDRIKRAFTHQEA